MAQGTFTTHGPARQRSKCSWVVATECTPWETTSQDELMICEITKKYLNTNKERDLSNVNGFNIFRYYLHFKNDIYIYDICIGCHACKRYHILTSPQSKGYWAVRLFGVGVGRSIWQISPVLYIYRYTYPVPSMYGIFAVTTFGCC